MYQVISFLEKAKRKVQIKVKILYWKIKYGNRLKIGKNLKFRKDFIINISKDGYLEIGDNNFFNNSCSINCHKKIVIGSNNLFGENVKIYDHNHKFNDKKLNMKENFTESEIKIGNNNWLGSNCVLLRKTDLADNIVISANCVINEKIEKEKLVKNSQNLNIVDIIYKE